MLVEFLQNKRMVGSVNAAYAVLLGLYKVTSDHGALAPDHSRARGRENCSASLTRKRYPGEAAIFYRLAQLGGHTG